MAVKKGHIQAEVKDLLEEEAIPVEDTGTQVHQGLHLGVRRKDNRVVQGNQPLTKVCIFLIS